MAITNADGSIVLTTKVDQGGLKKGMSTMKSSVSSLTASFGKLAGAIGVAFSVGAIVKFGKEASNLATKTEASIQRLIDIYGSASKAVGDFIDANAQALGISRTAAASYASIYGNLFSVWADQATNAELTNRYLNMTAVVASKTGRTVEDVQERIRSGLLGNTEAIEDLGIFVNIKTIEMTDAFQRMADGKSWEQLDAYTQQQIRSMAILEQATAKYGNEIAKTSALAKSQFRAAWEDFQATWGQVVNRVLMPALEVLTEILIKATTVTQIIFGISSETIEQSDAIAQAVDNQDKLTASVIKTEKATRKALAGFDDLQILTRGAEENASNESTSGGGLNSNLEFLPNVSKKQINIDAWERFRGIIKQISNLFMTGFWRGFENADFSRLKTDLNDIFQSIKNIFQNPEVSASIKNFFETFVVSFGEMIGSISSIGITLAQNLVSGIKSYLDENSPFISKKIAGIFDASSQLSEKVANLWNSFAYIFSTLADENGVSLTGNIISIFSNGFLFVTEIATKFANDFIGIISKPISDNKEELRLVLDDVLGFFANILTPIKDMLDGVGEKFDEVYENQISPFINNLSDGFSEIVSALTDTWEEHIAPVLDDFAKGFDETIDNHVAPALEGIIELFGNIIQAIDLAWEKWLKPFVLWMVEEFGDDIGKTIQELGEFFNSIITVVGDMVTAITGTLNLLMDFLQGDFIGTWEDVGEELSEIWKPAVNSIIDIFEKMINKIINGFENMLNWIVDGMNKISFDVPDWVPEIGGSSFGFNIGRVNFGEISIPRLAQGAVIPPNREFLAVLGDQKHGANIEAPLQTIVDAFNIALAQNYGTRSGNTEVILEIDGREFGRAVVEQGDKESRRIGTRLVIA